MQTLPDEVLRSHEHLSGLEQQLGTQRDSLIREYQRGGATSTQQLYGSYYPMLERFKHLQQQYAAELTKFKNGLKQAVDQNQPQQPPNPAPVQVQPQQQAQTVISNPNNNNITNNSQSRKIANMNQNGNNYGINNGINNGMNDDAKQAEVVNVNQVQPQQQQQQQQASNETDMKVSVDTLYQGPRGRKPPLGSTNNSASMTIPVQPPQAQQVQPAQQVIIQDRGQMNASQIVQSPSSQQERQQIAAPQRLPQHTRKPKKIVVNRHKYKYEGRGFDIWTRNLKRPIYTSTTIKINDSFRKNEKAVRQFLSQKGGLKDMLIEQVTFIDPKKNQNQRGGGRGGRGRNNDNDRPMKPFTIVRVRTSLKKIGNCIDRILSLDEYKDKDRDFVRKQNNRTRSDNRGNQQTSNKLFVKNFDILDKNTHWELTKLFLKFGELEQDIFIGRDKRQNPYAFVVFRSREAAKRCIQQHNQYQSTLFFPPKEKKNNDQYGYDQQQQSPRQSVYQNRKLHIEYNLPNQNDNNQGNRGQGGRGRRGGRGGGRGKGRR